MPNKRKSQFRHAAMRFEERTDIRFTREIHKEFVRKIRAGKSAVFVEHQSNRVSVWNVTHDAIEYRVVYDKLRGSIVTVLQTFDSKPSLPSP